MHKVSALKNILKVGFKKPGGQDIELTCINGKPHQPKNL
jgi:hypothetical protein